MPQSPSRRPLVLALALCSAVAAILFLSPGTASAHNTLLSSDPAAGATVPAAPTQIVWEFQNPVPLDTMTVTLVDPSGVRSELDGSVHGAAGETQVVTPLPALQPGVMSVRWRLVGADGHPITGRVEFTVAAVATTTVAPTPTAVPAEVVAPPDTTVPSATEGTAASAGDDGGSGFSTPSMIRWILRYSSYLAIMAVVGILLTSAYVWGGARTQPLLRRVLERALIATAVLAFLQLLVVASDVSGEAPWASLGSIDAATTTDAGMALAIRIVLALTMWLILFEYRIIHPDVYWTVASFASLLLLGTWAFAGHSRSMRWPELGVITDVAHHAAAAAWIAGLAIVGWIIIPTAAADVLVVAVRRFSRVAAISVAILVVIGIVQSIRLVGSPLDLFDADHGRYLAAKIAVLAAMLGIANINRRRVEGRLNPATVEQERGPLRKSVIAEFAVGLAIVGITAAMVVSPPSTSTSADRATDGESSALYYTL